MDYGTYKVVLGCWHEVSSSFPPRKGSRQRCKLCGSETGVLYIKGEWRLRCHDCRYTRYFGTAETTAKTKSTTHSIKYNHTVTLTCDGYPDLTTVLAQDSLSLEDIDDPPY